MPVTKAHFRLFGLYIGDAFILLFLQSLMEGDFHASDECQYRIN
jgi:hypothetical protein